MKQHSVTMLGTGLIGDFYTTTLHGQRGRDRVRVVYSRSAGRGEDFRVRHGVAEWSTDMEAAIRHPETDVVVVALPNFLHEEAVTAVAEAGKAVLVTKPLGRDAGEAKRMLDAVEKAGVFGGYLEDLVYTPKSLKSMKAIQDGAIGDVTWVRARETHPGPHSAWFWDHRLTGGGAIVDLGCRCIEIARCFVGKDNRPVEVMCHTDTLVHPIGAEDNAIALVRYESGAIGQFEVSWTFRGGMDLRDEVAGTRWHHLDQRLPAHGARDVHQRRWRRLRGREGRDERRLAVPRRRRGLRARLHGHVQRHVRSLDEGRAPWRRSTTATS